MGKARCVLRLDNVNIFLIINLCKSYFMSGKDLASKYFEIASICLEFSLFLWFCGCVYSSLCVCVCVWERVCESLLLKCLFLRRQYTWLEKKIRSQIPDAAFIFIIQEVCLSWLTRKVKDFLVNSYKSAWQRHCYLTWNMTVVFC